MKLLLKSFFILMFFTVFFLQKTQAQITVTGSTGADASYATLKLAFDAINSQPNQTGNDIVITITASTTETASAVLNQPTVGLWTSLTIYPTTTGLSINGGIAGTLIRLNGADNVTIDGRVDATGITPNLVITNTNTGTSASTIEFINSAENNTVQYCTIKGSGTSYSKGVLFFSTSISGNGNDNNLIDYNNITSDVAGRPIYTIYSLGTSGFENSNNIVSNNNIYDFFSKTDGQGEGVYIHSYNSDWTISDNSFYETSALVPAQNGTYDIIRINNAAGPLGVNYTISGNYIGGTSTLCGGSAWSKTNAFNNIFRAIYLENIGTATPSNIQNNTIKKFDWQNASNASWTAINVATGDVNIGTTNGNIIGNATTLTDPIKITNSGASAAYVYGIYIGSSGNINCQKNIIEAITTINDATTASNFFGIYKAPVAGTTTISYNTIGHPSNANSIIASSTSSGIAQSVYGINSAGTGSITISDNIIANLTNSTSNISVGTYGIIAGIKSTDGTNIVTNNTISNLTIANANNDLYGAASISGITLTNNTLKTVTGNTINNLSNTYASFTGAVIGLYFEANTGANIVSSNFIYGLTVNSASTASSIIGLRIATGTTSYYNNIISLGGNFTSSIYGIYETGSASNDVNLFFNTVYIYGNPTSGAINSFALYSSQNLNVRDFRNNIFFNARSNGGTSTAKHYAIYCNYSTNTGLTCNYNDYYANGAGGVIGYKSGADKTTLALWKTETGQDAGSLNSNPLFTDPGGTSPTDYKPAFSFTGNGLLGTGITVDFLNNLRPSPPTIGAWESATIDVWNGATFLAKYVTLKEAFKAINLGTHTGVLTIKINRNTLEASIATLNGSGTGAANYSSVNIYPTITGITVSGNISGPVVELNGADNVTIDGRVNATGATKDLIITNTATGGSSTIRFINSAENNTVQYCTIKGSETLSSRGIVFFSTATAGNGNDNNLISNNNITCTSAGRPVNGIYSEGSAGSENSGITISNNNIYDFLDPGPISSAVFLGVNTTNCTISGNNIYETKPFSTFANGAYKIINITNPSGTGFTVTGNYIGGRAALCGGLAWTKTLFNNTFSGIYMNVGTATASTVQNNTIKNFDWSNSRTGEWVGINVFTGDVNVTGNTIGAITGTGSIIITYSATQALVHAIKISSTGTVNCQSNNIGSFTARTINNSIGVYFYVIYKTATAGNTTISNNIVGSKTTANSISAASLSTLNPQILYSIYNEGTGTININNNTIANITNATTRTITSTRGCTQGITSLAGLNTINNNTIYNLTISNANSGVLNEASICGISLKTIGLSTISSNNIYNLTNNYASFTGGVIGIYFEGSLVSNVISQNFIHNFSVNSSSIGAKLFGIKKQAGITSVSNNIISLSTNTNSNIYGINETGAAGNNTSLYFNTVYIGGTQNTGVSVSYALYSSVNTNTRDFRNNIFHNVRTNTGTSTGKHYAIRLEGTTTLINYNDYFANGTGGVLGFLSVDRTTLALWQGATGQDAISINTDPNFTIPGGSIADDYLPNTTAVNIGTPIAGITTDYLNILRDAILPTIGALELVDIYKWTGNVDTKWDLPGNWVKTTRAGVIENPSVTFPHQYDDVLIPVVTKYPYITGVAAACNRQTINNGAKIEIAPNYSQTVNSTLTNNNLTLGNGIKIYSDATGTGSLIFYTPNVGGTVQTYQSGTQWHYISSTISPCNRTDFSDNTMYNWSSSVEWLGTTPTIDYAPWSIFSGTLTNGLGYANYTTTQTVDLSGTLNQGDISVNLNKSATGTEANQGWNLIGNPYTSALDWNAVVADPSFSTNGIETAMYLFNDNTQTGNQTNYQYWVPSTNSSGSPYGIGTGAASQYVPVGQGFFVKTKLDNMNISLKNSQRVHNTQSYYKTKNDSVSNLLRLKIASNNNNDELVVRFVEDATSNFDGNFDARKLFPESFDIPMLYAMNPLKDQTMAICSNGLITQQTQIPLGIRTNAGEFTINVEQYVFNSNLKIYLFDSQNNVYTDLSSQTQYSFISEIGYDNNRFSLVTEINAAPQVNIVLANQSTLEDTQYNQTIDASTFIDNNLFDQITYTAITPDWLLFDSNTMTISGTSNNDLVGYYDITITATDKFGASNSQSFQLEVINVNDAPIVLGNIENKTVEAENNFSFTFDETIFSDIDKNDVLTFNAHLANNTELPLWMNFNSNSRTFSGLPLSENIGNYQIELTATDIEGASISSNFNILVIENTSIISTTNKSTIQIYPNPSTGIFNIQIPELNSDKANYIIEDITGKKLMYENIISKNTLLNLSKYSKGIYFIEININNKTTRMKLIVN